MCHVLVQNAVYEGLPAEQRALSHRRAEHALEGLPSSPEISLERARHALGALTPESSAHALDLVLAAGRLLEDSRAIDRAHALMHNVHFLWRWTHQAHHSAERLDVLGFSYFHPFDITLSVVLATAVPALLGVTADAAALSGFIGFVYAVFQHLNIRTPRWLGYVIQRPEAHSVHHGRGVHAYNYGNLPWMDLLMGTFRNPIEFMQRSRVSGTARPPRSAPCCSAATWRSNRPAQLPFDA